MSSNVPMHTAELKAWYCPNQPSCIDCNSPSTTNDEQSRMEMLHTGYKRFESRPAIRFRLCRETHITPLKHRQESLTMGSTSRILRSFNKGLDEIRSIEVDYSLGHNQSKPMLLECSSQISTIQSWTFGFCHSGIWVCGWKRHKCGAAT
jgi:hypothetical protein